MKSTTTSVYSLKPYNVNIGVYGAAEPLQYSHPNDALARLNVANLLEVPEPTIVDLADGSQVRFYEVSPLSEVDDSRVIVRVMDFANGIAPHSYASALAVAELLGHRVIVLPWNDISLHHRERSIVRHGDFDPIVRRQAEAIGKTAVAESALTVYGYSLGAQVAPHLSLAINKNGDMQNDRLVMFEPPNTVRRSKIQLLKDFSRAGNPDWKYAIDDANWPALSMLVDDEYMAKDNKSFVLNALQPTNLSIVSAMQNPTLAEDVQRAGILMPVESRIVVAKELTSAMVPNYTVEEMHDRLENSLGRFGRDVLTLLVTPDTRELSVGHAVGNNPMIAASVIAR